MIRAIERLDPRLRLGKTQFAAIDLLAAGDDAGDRAEAHPHPRRTRVDEFGQRVGEHRRVELLGFAVDVEIGARKPRREQRRAETRRRGENLVDKGVFRAAQGQRVEPRGGDEIGGICAPLCGEATTSGRRSAVGRCSSYMPHGSRHPSLNLSVRSQNCHHQRRRTCASRAFVQRPRWPEHGAPATRPAWKGNRCSVAGLGNWRCRRSGSAARR